MKTIYKRVTWIVAMIICTIVWFIGNIAQIIADVCQLIIDWVFTVIDCENPDCEFHHPKKDNNSL